MAEHGTILPKPLTTAALTNLAIEGSVREKIHVSEHPVADHRWLYETAPVLGLLSEFRKDRTRRGKQQPSPMNEGLSFVRNGEN